MSELLAELKRRFKSPAEALKALGLDEKTIVKLAMDEDPDMPENAEECLSKLREMILNLAPAEQQNLLEELRDLVDSGDPGQWATSTGDVEPNQPPYFEGRPERAQDRARLAQDAGMDRAARAFDARHGTQSTERARADF